MIDLTTYPTTAAERSAQWHHEASRLYASAWAYPSPRAAVLAMDHEAACRAAHPGVGL